MIQPPYLLVSGCSHTVGVGIDRTQVWAQQVAQELNLDLVNVARGSSCAKYVCDSLIDWIDHASVPPDLVVAQWPNPYRIMEIINGAMTFYNVNSNNENFKNRLKNRPETFVEEWFEHILKFNTYCQVPLINIYLDEDQESTSKAIQDLHQQGISLHIDKKRPGETWYFDSAASDNSHHSESCHKKWAERIVKIFRT
jgi:hypothetical protein